MKINVLHNWIFTVGLLLSSPFIFSQEIELNDPQIISVIETINRIDQNYGRIAIDQGNNQITRKLSRTMVDDHTKLLNQTKNIKDELILSTQTNNITRFLLNRNKKNTQMLDSTKKEYFDVSYINNEVEFHRMVVSIVKEILKPQVKNKKLKEFLIKILPGMEEHLKIAKKTQVRINR